MSAAQREASGNASPDRVDIGIVTVQEIELEAVLEHIPPYRRLLGRRVYNLCRLKTEKEDTYQIAVLRGLSTGTTDTMEAVRDLMEELSPIWLFLVGMADGLDEDTLGDVVVSSKIAEFTAEAELSGGQPKYSVGGGSIAREAGIVVANLPALKRSLGPWNQGLGSSPRMVDRPPTVSTGIIASSERGIPDTRILNSWLALVRGIKAVDMESAGVFRIASNRNVPLITIRGIGDVIGKFTSRAWRRYASYAAASFTAAFLRTRPVEPHSPTSDTATSGDPVVTDKPLIAPEQTPFRIEELTLTDVRGFGGLALSLTNLPADSGQWMILLGTNGVGKTTILRALALVLSSDEVVQALLGRLGRASPMVRLSATQATIQVKCPAGYLPRLVLGAGETSDRLDERGRGEVTAPFTVAYGCRRGSALGGSSREVNATSPLGAVETLFDEGADLVHAETWLKERKLAATLGQGSPDEAFFNAVIVTLIDLLPGVTAIRVGANLVEVEGPKVGRVPLGALSDGYLTTTGWVLDLIARWAEDAKRRGISLDDSFRERMTGVAIIDELDLHLHPQWQREVIADVRRLFPRMSFVVTTHNPLTLLGARPGEIHVLRRDQSTGQMAVRQHDLPPGMGAERILTGEWFDLASTLDEDTLKLLDEHRLLLRTGPPDAPAANKLEEELTARLGSYAATSIERLALSAAAQVLDDDARTLSAEDREAALVKIKELLHKPASPSKAGRKKRKAS